VTAPPSAHLSDSQVQQLRRQLLNKGAELSAVLSAILAGSAVDPRQLIGSLRPQSPGERPTERLRRFLDLIDSRLRATRDGTYGACTSCGEPLGFIALTQMPWADQCQACAEAA
jgi:hypothetical protein